MSLNELESRSDGIVGSTAMKAISVEFKRHAQTVVEFNAPLHDEIEGVIAMANAMQVEKIIVRPNGVGNVVYGQLMDAHARGTLMAIPELRISSKPRSD